MVSSERKPLARIKQVYPSGDSAEDPPDKEVKEPPDEEVEEPPDEAVKRPTDEEVNGPASQVEHEGSQLVDSSVGHPPPMD